jgi:hypothetical protein
MPQSTTAGNIKNYFLSPKKPLMKKNLRPYLFIACVSIVNITHAQTGGWKLAGNNLVGTEKLGSKNNFDVNLISNNATRMTIKADGKIGFGTTNPVTRFNFYGLTRN